MRMSFMRRLWSRPQMNSKRYSFRLGGSARPSGHVPERDVKFTIAVWCSSKRAFMKLSTWSKQDWSSRAPGIKPAWLEGHELMLTGRNHGSTALAVYDSPRTLDAPGTHVYTHRRTSLPLPRSLVESSHPYLEGLVNLVRLAEQLHKVIPELRIDTAPVHLSSGAVQAAIRRHGGGRLPPSLEAIQDQRCSVGLTQARALRQEGSVRHLSRASGAESRKKGVRSGREKWGTYL